MMFHKPATCPAFQLAAETAANDDNDIKLSELDRYATDLMMSGTADCRCKVGKPASTQTKPRRWYDVERQRRAALTR